MAGTPQVLCIQSHVVHGFVGNRCASFCLERLGIAVDVLNTVQFSNHTGYPRFTGTVLKEGELLTLYDSLDDNGLTRHTHILTGYVGGRSALEEIVQVVQRARRKRPEVMFVCDPVMGDDGKLYIPMELVEVYRQDVVPLANVVLPNQFEAELLTAITIRNIDDAAAACRKLHTMGPHTVVLTSMNDPSSPESCLTLFASTTQKQSPSHLSTFKLDIPRIDASFTGTGDLLGALLLALMMERPTELDWVCEEAVSRLHSLLEQTYSQQPRVQLLELDLIHSQQYLLEGGVKFHASAYDVTTGTS